jgi:uncharacterized membrane protein YqhA
MSICGSVKQNPMENEEVPENLSKGNKAPADQHIVENMFERVLWNMRFIVLLGVFFGALSAIVLFIAGSTEIYHIVAGYLMAGEHTLSHEEILIGIIGAVDFYLIGLVLIIFSFGIYELFISNIDIARLEGGFGNLLDIENLDDLKNKIIKVIIMVLIVTFFQRILSMEFTTSIDMLAMAVSICVICIGVYFLGKHGL